MAKKTKVSKTVRGPQLALKLKGAKPKQAAKQAKAKDGNPVFALRVPAELLAKFRKHAKSKDVDATLLVRQHMAKVVGFKLAGGAA